MPLFQAQLAIPPASAARNGSYDDDKTSLQVWSAVVDGALTSTSLNNKGTAILLLKQVSHVM